MRGMSATPLEISIVMPRASPQIAMWRSLSKSRLRYLGQFMLSVSILPSISDAGERAFWRDGDEIFAKACRAYRQLARIFQKLLFDIEAAAAAATRLRKHLAETEKYLAADAAQQVVVIAAANEEAGIARAHGVGSPFGAGCRRVAAAVGVVGEHPVYAVSGAAQRACNVTMRFVVVRPVERVRAGGARFVPFGSDALSIAQQPDDKGDYRPRQQQKDQRVFHVLLLQLARSPLSRRAATITITMPPAWAANTCVTTHCGRLYLFIFI